MNEPPKREDVEALAGEMRDLKEVLREVSGKLGRIEKRLRAFFPDSFPENKARREPSSNLRENAPTITPQQALDLYTELVTLARSGQEQEVASRAGKLDIADLALLVRELGAPLGKKPTRSGLTKSLMSRLKESVLLSRHTNRPSPNSSPAQNDKVSDGAEPDQADPRTKGGESEEDL